jgi:hypothetical protein
MKGRSAQKWLFARHGCRWGINANVYAGVPKRSHLGRYDDNNEIFVQVIIHANQTKCH